MRPLVTVIALAASLTAWGHDYPRVGFEFELRQMDVVRYKGSTSNSAGKTVEESPWESVEERTGNYRLAKTAGPVPLMPKWPLFQITADNAKTGKKYLVLFNKFNDSNTEPVFSGRSRPNYAGLEIVTGPIWRHDTALQKAVINAIHLFLEVQFAACKGRNPRPGPDDYFALSSIVKLFNDQLATNVDPEQTRFADQLKLEMVPPDNVYMTCPSIIKSQSGSVDATSTNANAQLTLGAPLRNYETLMNRRGNGWDILKPDNSRIKIDKILEKDWTFDAHYEPVSSVKSMILLWNSFVRCALSPSEHATSGKPQIWCTKSEISPTPHVDLCELAARQWKINSRTVKDRGMLREHLINIANHLLKSSHYKSQKVASWQDAHHQNLTDEQLVKGFVDSLLSPENCKDFWRDRQGRFMALWDATIVEALLLTIDEQTTMLGFALEFRNNQVSTDVLFKSKTALLPEISDRFLEVGLADLPVPPQTPH